MKVLIAFDGEININEFIDLINNKSVYEISLLDFSSNFSLMKDLHSTLRSKGVKSIKVISMTELFNEEINIIREKINKCPK